MSLAQQGAGIDTLRAASAQFVTLALPPDKQKERDKWDAWLSAWSGDFEAIAAASPNLERNLPANATLEAHGRIAWNLAQALVESRRLRDADVAARAFLAQADLWVPASVDGPFTDPTPRLIEVERLASTISPAQQSERLVAWIAKWTKLSPSKDAADAALIAAYLWPAETREQAADALQRLPQHVPLSYPNLDANFILGKANFLAGRIDEALPYLRRAADACLGLATPVDTTHAALMLGHALDSKGDKAGACAAYKIVLDRWGKAKPRSVSADDARVASAKLGCER
jgi:serine/threonine-protein kinase